jgi:hypothetical protein
MTPERQKAESIKYDSSYVWSFAEIEPGLFALYNHKRQLVLLTDDIHELLGTYRARPPYFRSERVEKTKPTADKAANTARILAAIRGSQP